MCVDGGGKENEKLQRRSNLEREHRLKYGNYWDKTYACKLSDKNQYNEQ